jgi:hypothetical protein
MYHYAGNIPVKYVDPDGEEMGMPRKVERILEARQNNNRVFATTMNSLVGVPYDFGGNSRSGVDCSGTVLLALVEMGYDVKQRISAADMSSGGTDWINMKSSVDGGERTGDIGVLNFYKNGDSPIVNHVNVGVGDTGTPTPLLNPKPQVVDATSEEGVLHKRAGLPGQYYTPKLGQVNQTYAPSTTMRDPAKQGTIDWGVLENKYRKENE